MAIDITLSGAPGRATPVARAAVAAYWPRSVPLSLVAGGVGLALLVIVASAVTLGLARTGAVPALDEFAAVIGERADAWCEPFATAGDGSFAECFVRPDSGPIAQVVMSATRGEIHVVRLVPQPGALALGDLVALWGRPSLVISGPVVEFTWRPGLTARGDFLSWPVSLQTPVHLIRFASDVPRPSRNSPTRSAE